MAKLAMVFRKVLNVRYLYVLKFSLTRTSYRYSSVNRLSVNKPRFFILQTNKQKITETSDNLKSIYTLFSCKCLALFTLALNKACLKCVSIPALTIVSYSIPAPPPPLPTNQNRFTLGMSIQKVWM